MLSETHEVKMGAGAFVWSVICEEPERGGRPANELDWTRISSTWGWVSSLRSPRLQSQTCSLDCN